MTQSKRTNVGISEAKRRLSELIEGAMQGKSVVISRYGRPIARLIPYQASAGRVSVQESINGLRRLRKGMRLRGLKPRQMIDEGRM